MKELDPSLSERPTHRLFDPEAELERNPIEKLREMQSVAIRFTELRAILGEATTIPDLEAIARQSTKDVEALLAARHENPLPGEGRRFSFLELGPRDDELNGLLEIQNILYKIFDEMYGRSAMHEYQIKVEFDSTKQTIEEYENDQYAFGLSEADRLTSEVCPSPAELQAKSWGKKSHKAFLRQRATKRTALIK